MLETSPSSLRPLGNGDPLSHVNSLALAESLLLMRASTMKMVRLQLAMERRDRALALQTMDEIVELDDRMSDFLDEMPIAGAGLEAMRSEVEEQRSAVAREKFGLAAGVRKRDEPIGPRPWIDSVQPPLAEPTAQAKIVNGADALEPLELTDTFLEEFTRRRAPWAKILFAVVLLMLVGGAVASAFLLQPDFLTDHI